MILDFEEMRRIYRLERSTARLVDVPEDFFSQLHTLIEEERTKYFDSMKDLNTTRARDFGNLKKLIDEWFLVREKKLLNTVLISARLDEVDTTHMAGEEKKMFSAVYDALMVHRGITRKVLDANGEFVSIAPANPAPPIPSLSTLQPMREIGKRDFSISKPAPESVPANIPIPVAVAASPPSSTSSSSPSPSPPRTSNTESIPVRILSEIPSFVGTDMKEYGPYKSGQVVDLPGKIAQLFISRELGENAE